jgi:hypothetical protein
MVRPFVLLRGNFYRYRVVKEHLPWQAPERPVSQTFALPLRGAGSTDQERTHSQVPLLEVSRRSQHYLRLAILLPLVLAASSLFGFLANRQQRSLASTQRRFYNGLSQRQGGNRFFVRLSRRRFIVSRSQFHAKR